VYDDQAFVEPDMVTVPRDSANPFVYISVTVVGLPDALPHTLAITLDIVSPLAGASVPSIFRKLLPLLPAVEVDARVAVEPSSALVSSVQTPPGSLAATSLPSR